MYIRKTDHFRFPSYLEKYMRYYRHFNGICSGMFLFRWHDSCKGAYFFDFQKSFRLFKEYKELHSKNELFIYFVEFPYICKLSCLDDFNEKRTQKHTLQKYYEKTRATVFSSLAASTDGLLQGVYCRGGSTNVGLEIAALPRFAASVKIL